jgi:hypothetical protein
LPKTSLINQSSTLRYGSLSLPLCDNM